MSLTETRVTEVSIPLPRALDTRIYMRLAVQAKAILVFLTSAAPDQGGGHAMGSFVYALPDRFNAQQPLATTLFASEASVEFATRIARLLARRTQMPVYVTCSLSLEGAGLGTVEEELEAYRAVAGALLSRL